MTQRVTQSPPVQVTVEPPDKGFGSFIVTYNRPARLAETIASVLRQTVVPDTLLVVDNGSGDSAQQVVESIGDPRVGYIRTGSNLGSAGGAAFGMRTLHERGHAWMHSIDDDDPLKTDDTIERLQSLIARHRDAKLGAVAAVGSRWDWRHGLYSRLPDDALRGDVRVDVIGGNAQLVVGRELLDTIGTPNPEFFFGHYDPLFCLKAGKFGFELWVDGDLHRRYRELAGRLDLEKTRARIPRNADYQIWRRYYVSRNYIHEMRHTFDRPDLARREATRAASRSVLAWLRGPRYGWHFSRLQMRGVLDGYRDRLGLRVAPQPKPSAE